MIELEFSSMFPHKGSHHWQLQLTPLLQLFRNSFGDNPFWSVSIGWLFWEASLTINR